MVSLNQFYNLEQRVFVLEAASAAAARSTASNSLKVYDPITLLLETSSENVKSVDPSSVLKYLSQADIFVRIYIHNVKTSQASSTITEEAGYYYHYFIVENNFTVFVLSKKYMVYENNTLYLDDDRIAGLYFTDSAKVNIPKLDGLFFLVNSPNNNNNNNNMRTVSAQLIKKAVGGVAVDVHKSKQSIINIDVKILGDAAPQQQSAPDSGPQLSTPEENFGIGNSPTKPTEHHFDGGGD